MKRPVKSFPRSYKRQGTVLILVLAVCAVAVSLVMISLQVSLQQRRTLRRDLQLEQTRWVLDAAIRKSIADLLDEANEFELEPKLEKFETALIAITPKPDQERVAVQAKIEGANGTNVTSRSASFEAAN